MFKGPSKSAVQKSAGESDYGSADDESSSVDQADGHHDDDDDARMMELVRCVAAGWELKGRASTHCDREADDPSKGGGAAGVTGALNSAMRHVTHPKTHALDMGIL